MSPEASKAPPPTISAALWRELESSRQLGLIGPSPLDEHVRHAIGYLGAAGVVPRAVADLGSGGGLPALVLAERWPECRFTLIDVRERAIARLDVMVARLGWHHRVDPWLGSAESAGRLEALRGGFDLVTARGFGPPAMTAECAAPLLRVGGRLVVSEPPTDEGRWPEAALTLLALRRVEETVGPYAVLEATEPCPERFPRRSGQPRNAPLW